MDYVPTWRTRGAAVLAALSLLIPVSAAAAPDQDEIDAAHAALASTESQIAAIELELAGIATLVTNAEIAAAQAFEALLRAEEDLEAATANATEARARADESAATLEESRGNLAALARQTYQGGSTSVGTLMPFLTENPSNALGVSTYLTQISARTDADVQAFEALAAVDEVLQGQAEAALTEKVEAEAVLARAADDAQRRVDESETQLRLTTERREQLLGQLASQRQTTIDLERARQDELDRQARENANILAQQEALAQEPQAPSAAPAPRPPRRRGPTRTPRAPRTGPPFPPPPSRARRHRSPRPPPRPRRRRPPRRPRRRRCPPRPRPSRRRPLPRPPRRPPPQRRRRRIPPPRRRPRRLRPRPPRPRRGRRPPRIPRRPRPPTR